MTEPLTEPLAEAVAAPRVVIVDDQELVRTGLEMVLSARGIDVVGLAADGREAIAVTRELRPDVVLMDIRMPVMDGASSASPARTSRTAAVSCSGATSLSRNPLAPAARAAYT